MAAQGKSVGKGYNEVTKLIASLTGQNVYLSFFDIWDRLHNASKLYPTLRMNVTS